MEIILDEQNRHALIEQCPICEDVATYIARYADTWLPMDGDTNLENATREWHWYIEGFDCGH